MKPVEITIAGVKMRVEPTGAPGLSPQRTESLARELVRGLLGSGAAPTLELTRGPGAGAWRELPPPEARWIIGRGDEATWVILDEDLSREHVEIARGWDGVTIRDLDSKNGTRVDGKRLTAAMPLRDGAMIELGNCALVFRDPAEKHMHGEVTARTPTPPPIVSAPPPVPASSRATFLIATGVCGLSLAALVWVLAQ